MFGKVRKGELLTLTEAGAAAGVSDRTLRKYTRQGRITPEIGADGRPRYYRPDVEALRLIPTGVRNGSEGFGREGSEAFGTDRNRASDPPDAIPLNGASHGASHDLSPGAAA